MLNDENELKGLQVKAELDKLGKPPRAFSEYLLLENEAEGEAQMEDCNVLGSTARMTIAERFSRVERAKRAVHPVTIKLAKRLKTALEGQASPAKKP